VTRRDDGYPDREGNSGYEYDHSYCPAFEKRE